MPESVGVISFGFGPSTEQKSSGKSSFLNDLMFPQEDCDCEPFETEDMNVYSDSQIDVFFLQEEGKNDVAFMDI